MPKQVDPVAQRGEIRRAARRVFARRGVAGTGLAHVADAARMGRSSLYHYYPDKAALLRDLIRELLEQEAALFHAAARGEGSPFQRIEKLVATLTRSFEEGSRLGPMLLQLRASDAPRFRPFFRRIRRDLASVIAAGQRQGEIDADLDAQLAAACVIGLLDGLWLQHVVDSNALPDGKRLEETVVLSVRRMLRP